MDELKVSLFTLKNSNIHQNIQQRERREIKKRKTAEKCLIVNRMIF